MKKFFIALFALATVYGSLAANVKAQTNFLCDWTPDGCRAMIGGACLINGGGSEDQYCSQFSLDNCGDQGGICNASCGGTCLGSCTDGYVPLAGSCTDSNKTCCIQEDQEPEDPAECWQCQTNAGRGICSIVNESDMPPAGVSCGDAGLFVDQPSCQTACDDISEPAYFVCTVNGCVEGSSGPFVGLEGRAACEAACGNFRLPPCGDPATDVVTAIGCMPLFRGINDVAGFFWKWAFGLGGGIAMLIIVYAGFLYMTSSGDPRKMSESASLAIAAISGLFVLTLAGFILRLLGVNVLGLFG